MGRASVQNEFIEHTTDDIIIFSRFLVLWSRRIVRTTSFAQFKSNSLSRRFKRWNFYDFSYKLGEKYYCTKYILLWTTMLSKWRQPNQTKPNGRWRKNVSDELVCCPFCRIESNRIKQQIGFADCVWFLMVVLFKSTLDKIFRYFSLSFSQSSCYHLSSAILF